MNYIKRLQGENTEAKRRLQVIQDTCQEYRVFLQTDKFVGVDTNGDRKDWMSAKDVDAILQMIHSQAIVGC